jgi:hypothetical protein
MRVYFFVTLAILVIVFGWFFLLQSANARIEASCAASGGQVLTQPGELSKCLRFAQ